jgi:hypothetical protein
MFNLPVKVYCKSINSASLIAHSLFYLKLDILIVEG